MVTPYIYPPETHKAYHEGTNAYWDSFSGLVPCRVIKIDEEEKNSKYAGRGSSCSVTFVITEDFGPYEAGEEHTQWAIHVCPRKCVKYHKYSTCIVHDYKWIAKNPTPPTLPTWPRPTQSS